MRGAGRSHLPSGLQGPEPQSLWKSIFLKLLTPGLQMASVWGERGAAAGLRGWDAKPVQRGCCWEHPKKVDPFFPGK